MTEQEWTIDISRYWQKGQGGLPRTINSVSEEIRGTENQVSPNTLKLAREGTYDRGKFSNAVKLARLCSLWIGRRVTVDQILKSID